MASIITKITEFFRTERKEPRFPAFGNFPGCFKNKQGQEFSAIPVDISAGGLGILIDPTPIAKEIITLCFDKENQTYNIDFKVVHVSASTVRPVNSLEKMRRCGLEMQGSEDVNLVTLLSGQDYLMVQE